MMKRYNKILIFIFFLILAFRIFFVFQTPYFSSDEAYFHIRHTEAIDGDFKPLINDELSYGGRVSINSPIYHYSLSFFKAFLPYGLAYKIIPEILLAALVFVIFYIARSITNNVNAALLSAFIGGFIPMLVSETINQVSIYSLIWLLVFSSIYFLLNLKKHLTKFIIIAFLLSLIHPFSFVVSLAFLLYILLLNIDSMRINRTTKEAVIFFVFVSILINLIIYKKAFLSYGLLAVWQNMPNQLLLDFFKNVNILDILYGVGIIPLILGIMGFLFGLFREKKNVVYLLGAMILTMFILLFLKLISFSVGVMFLGILLTIMSALALDKIIAYIDLTKFAKYKRLIFVAFIVLIMGTMVLPSYMNATDVIDNTITQEEVNTLKWIWYNTPQDSTVLASVEEGNYITSISQRANVADTNFLLVPDRYSDVSTVFTTESLVVASQILEKYDVDYIYLSDRALDIYNVDKIKYIGDENCFEKIYSTKRTSVFKVLC